MKISILTLFPEMFQGPFEYSIIKRAREKGLIEIIYVNIREFGIGKHKAVDDTPYGGGIGMVMRVDVIHSAIMASKCQTREDTNCREKTILLSASGKTFKQSIAKTYSNLDHLILVCGHYEGIDARIKHFIDEEISIGDFVVTGGEIPAMLITDAVTRLIPNVLKEGATENESFSLGRIENPRLEYPHFTRPQLYKNHAVPEILLSGNHHEIEKWRVMKSYEKTEDIKKITE